MKKFLSMLAATALCLSLAACGNSAAGNSPAPSGSNDAPGVNTASGSSGSVWPSGDVTVYVPANAGGSSDTIARLYAEKFKSTTGANFIIVNDTTGANSVAYETVRTAKPDGLTLMAYHGGLCTQHASGQYAHSLDEFTVLGNMTTADNTGYGIWVSGKSDFQTFDDLISYAKDHPGELVAGVETNNTDHLLEVMFEDQFGVDLAVVSAGSNAEKLPLLMGGNLDVCFFAPGGVTDYHTSGDLRCLAFFGSARTDLLPDVPCMTDLNYEPIMLPLFFFLAGPADMPDEVCAAINEVMKEAAADETILNQITTMGMEMAESLSVEAVQQQAHDMQQNYLTAYELMKAE